MPRPPSGQGHTEDVSVTPLHLQASCGVTPCLQLLITVLVERSARP